MNDPQSFPEITRLRAALHQLFDDFARHIGVERTAIALSRWLRKRGWGE